MKQKYFQMKRPVLLIITTLISLFMPLMAIAAEPNPAKSWDRHFNLWLLISAVIWFSVTIPLIYFAIKYRKRREGEEGADIHGNTFLEVLWTAIPLIIVILLGTQTWALFKEYRQVPQNAYEVRIEGFQFGYEMTYPEGITTTNELRIPVGVPIKAVLTSRDVLHTFFLPKFRVKEDMIPGRKTYMWFRADEPAEYPAFCSEYCGISHSLMRGKVTAMKKEDFNRWIAEHKKTVTFMPPEARGKKLVKDLGCLECHSITGEKGIGPTFKVLYGSERMLTDGRKVIADEAYIKESIINAKAEIVLGYDPIMPPYSMSEKDLNAVIVYLKTIK